MTFCERLKQMSGLNQAKTIASRGGLHTLATLGGFVGTIPITWYNNLKDHGQTADDCGMATCMSIFTCGMSGVYYLNRSADKFLSKREHQRLNKQKDKETSVNRQTNTQVQLQ